MASSFETSRARRLHVLLEEHPDGHLDLAQRLATDVGKQQRLVVVAPGHRRHLDQRAGGVLTELRIDRSQRGMSVDHDFVRCQRD